VLQLSIDKIELLLFQAHHCPNEFEQEDKRAKNFENRRSMYQSFSNYKEKRMGFLKKPLRAAYYVNS